jgi:hypothetical protein
VRRSYDDFVQTVVDIDEKVLSLAEQKARRDGMSLGALVEEALRAVLHLPPPLEKTCAEEHKSIDGDDAFFASLDEIRALGRFPAEHRQVDLP